MVTIMVVTMVIASKRKVKYSGLKMLKTIITEAFSSIWVYFHKHSRFTGLPEKGEAISLTSNWGQTFLDKKFMARLF